MSTFYQKNLRTCLLPKISPKIILCTSLIHVSNQYSRGNIFMKILMIPTKLFKCTIPNCRINYYSFSSRLVGRRSTEGRITSGFRRRRLIINCHYSYGCKANCLLGLCRIISSSFGLDEVGNIHFRHCQVRGFRWKYIKINPSSYYFMNSIYHGIEFL